MMLPKEAIIEYQQIYKTLFGKEIDSKEAEQEGMKLLDLMFVIENEEMKYENSTSSFHTSAK